MAKKFKKGPKGKQIMDRTLGRAFEFKGAISDAELKFLKDSLRNKNLTTGSVFGVTPQTNKFKGAISDKELKWIKDFTK
tara:strand:- start:432 stop:668 length:237 start_codon:yes stop_codon:yes gene_type:complete